jgi:gamma-glutamylcyclotransferase (GGCT)/AIG2-like uncharacterized protein YtfP
MNPHLFVYGTLQRGFTNPFARALHDAAVCLGSAQIPGKLYLLGNRDFLYPGAAHDPTADTMVQGELWQLDNPAATLAVLDHYEGTTPEHPLPHEYQRMEISVTTATGTTIAWCYVLNRPALETQHIRSGKFTPPNIAK